MEDFKELQEVDLKINMKTSNQAEDKKESQKNNIKDNGTLLISEIQNKVILPYTAEEVREILNDENNNYKTAEEVINSNFTKTLSEYKDPYTARMRECVKLLTERENYSKLDGYNLGIELFNNRYLHPAIIAACKNLDELNVYLDCLDKNELDDFKVFKVKYELYPVIIEKSRRLCRIKNICERIKSFFKGISAFDITKRLKKYIVKN